MNRRNRFLVWLALSLSGVAFATMTWTHDLGLGAITLRYPGSEKQASASYYSVAPGTEVTVSVPVQNLSSNPSMPYRIDIAIGGQTVATENASALPSGVSKEHYLKFRMSQPGKFMVVATLTLTRQPPGSSKKTCSECKARNCDFPRYCQNGTTGDPCACHPMGDNPLNNTSQSPLEVQGSAPPAGPSPGADLIVESAGLTNSIVKPGIYEAHFIVTNVGADAAVGSFAVEVRVGQQSQSFRITGGLKPGESKSGMVEFLKSGSMTVTVDPRNEVRESNKSNNVKR